jgi:hypothetical protein
MTKVIFHGPIQSFRGRIGNMIFRQLPDGTTVVTGAPAKLTGRQKKRAKLKRSPAQQAHNRRFEEAAFYARRAAKIQPIYTELAAATPMKTAYNFALSDWWHAPEIHGIEKKDGCIRVEVTDNIWVTRVQVSVLDEDGKVREVGEGIRSDGNWWEFASQVEGKTIIAEAWDLPGHIARFVMPQ